MNRLLMFVFSRKAVKSEAYEASEIHAVRPFFCFLFVFFPLGCVQRELKIYAEVNLVTALVPSETACLANSPGRTRRTAVWISRLERVAFLLYRTSLPASSEIFPKMSLMKEFMMDIPFLDIPVSGCTCFKTL